MPQFNPTPIDLDKLKSILGPPPLLSTESAESYDAMLFHYMDALKPRDFLLQMLVKDLVDADWESSRFRRHKSWAVERRDLKWRELQDRHLETTKKKVTSKENSEVPQTESERLWELELETEQLGANCIKLVDGLRKPNKDVELSRAMEEAINYYERLDRLEKDCLAKRVIILEQFRLYDEALYLRAARYSAYLNQLESDRLVEQIAVSRHG